MEGRQWELSQMTRRAPLTDEKLGELHDRSQATVSSVSISWNIASETSSDCMRWVEKIGLTDDRSEVVGWDLFCALLLRHVASIFFLLSIMEKLGKEELVDLVCRRAKKKNMISAEGL